MTCVHSIVKHSQKPTVLSLVYRTLEEIKPEDFCSSYRRLVLRDWTPDDTLDGEDDVVAYSVSHKTSKEERKNLASTEQIIVQINTLRDSMDEDEDYVLPINFPVVSGILLEFLHVLGEGMVCLVFPPSYSQCV